MDGEYWWRSKTIILQSIGLVSSSKGPTASSSLGVICHCFSPIDKSKPFAAISCNMTYVLEGSPAFTL